MSGKPSTGYGFEHTSADAVAVLKATRRRRPILVGHSWGAMVAIDVAARYPTATSGVVLIDGGVTAMRDGFSSWAEAREALSPPHLAGTPVEEFRAMVPMFFGDALDVTPEVVDIVLAVMRVGADGTIRPRLDAREPPQDPARDLGARPGRAARRAARAGPRDPRRGRRPRLGRAPARGCQSPAPGRREDARHLDRGDPRPSAATPSGARAADRNVRANRRTIGRRCSCSSYCS